MASRSSRVGPSDDDASVELLGLERCVGKRLDRELSFVTSACEVARDSSPARRGMSCGLSGIGTYTLESVRSTDEASGASRTAGITTLAVIGMSSISSGPL